MTDAFTLLEGLCKQATPGPWRNRPGRPTELAAVITDDPACSVAWGILHKPNAAYIAALAPETVLAMIETLRRADVMQWEIWDEHPKRLAFRDSRARLESLLSKGSL